MFTFNKKNFISHLLIHPVTFGDEVSLQESLLIGGRDTVAEGVLPEAPVDLHGTEERHWLEFGLKFGYTLSKDENNNNNGCFKN